MLDYAVRRSPRSRRARLTVRDDGQVVVTLPLRASLGTAERLVVSEAAWIERHRARALEARARLACRLPLGQGGLITLRGVPHLVVAEHGSSRHSQIRQEVGSPPRLRVRRGLSDQRPLHEIIAPWLRSLARLELEDRVARRAGQLCVEPRHITIRDQRTRWGSASSSGRLSFNWRLVLAPPPILDYVVVHELAHLVRFGHGPRFWSLVRQVLPDADGSRLWLRRHGRELREALY